MTERSIAAAARVSGFNERTVRRLLDEDDHVREAYRRDSDAVLAPVRPSAKAAALEALRAAPLRAQVADLDLLERVEALERAIRPRRAAA